MAAYFQVCSLPSVSSVRQCPCVSLSILIYNWAEVSIPVCRILYCRRSSGVTSQSRAIIPVCDFALRSILVCGAQYPSEYPSVQLCTAQYSCLQCAVSKRNILVCSGQYPSEYPNVQRPDRPDRSPPATTALCQRCTLLQCCQHRSSPLLLLLYCKTIFFDILLQAVHIAAMLFFHVSYCFYCKVINTILHLLVFFRNNYSLPALHIASFVRQY